MTKLRRHITIGVAVVGISILGIAPAAAHSQTVDPPAHDEPIVDQGVSRLWAQAHCKAQSPTLVHIKSDGVVEFSPNEALPCLNIWENPGGQVHPHAVDPPETE